MCNRAKFIFAGEYQFLPIESKPDLFALARPAEQKKLKSKQLQWALDESETMDSLSEYYTPPYDIQFLLGLKLKCDSHSIENTEPPDDEGLSCAWTTASSCWFGLYAIMRLRGEPLSKVDDLFKYHGPIERKVTLPAEVEFLTQTNNKIYYCEWEGRESHYFAIQIRNEELLYAGSYGGECLIQFKLFQLTEWIKLLQQAMDGSMQAYIKVFNLENAQVCLPQPDFEFLRFMYN